jgi:hypothetical protein
VRRRAQGEAGVSMILALGFLAMFSVFVPKLLDLGSTNLLATSRLQEERTIVYVADGSTDAAIQYLRIHPECGRLGEPCPISQLSWTVGPTTAVTTFSFAGGGLDFDRTFNLSTSVAGQTRVEATVIIRDLNPQSLPEPPVDVKSWKYTR